MLEVLQTYQYPLLFLFLIVGDELILLPAVYLAMIGVFNFVPLVVIALLANIISDSAWYGLGRILPADRVSAKFDLNRNSRLLDRISYLFDKYHLKFLIFYRFIYGARAITRIMYGVKRVPYGRYVLASLAGLVTWLAVVLPIGFLIGTSVESLQEGFHKFGFVVGFLIGLVVLALLVERLVSSEWLKTLGQERARK